MKISAKIRDTFAAIGFIFLSMLCVARFLPAENGKYDLSENQTLRLQVKQAKSQVAYMQKLAADAQYNQASNDFSAELAKIVKENGWPEKVQIKQNPDPQKADQYIVFDPPAPPAPPTPAPQPPKS